MINYFNIILTELPRAPSPSTSCMQNTQLAQATLPTNVACSIAFLTPEDVAAASVEDAEGSVGAENYFVNVVAVLRSYSTTLDKNILNRIYQTPELEYMQDLTFRTRFNNATYEISLTAQRDFHHFINAYEAAFPTATIINRPERFSPELR